MFHLFRPLMFGELMENPIFLFTIFEMQAIEQPIE